MCIHWEMDGGGCVQYTQTATMNEFKWLRRKWKQNLRSNGNYFFFLNEFRFLFFLLHRFESSEAFCNYEVNCFQFFKETRRNETVQRLFQITNLGVSAGIVIFPPRNSSFICLSSIWQFACASNTFNVFISFLFTSRKHLINTFVLYRYHKFHENE